MGPWTETATLRDPVGLGGQWPAYGVYHYADGIVICRPAREPVEHDPERGVRYSVGHAEFVVDGDEAQWESKSAAKCTAEQVPVAYG